MRKLQRSVKLLQRHKTTKRCNNNYIQFNRHCMFTGANAKINF